MMRTWWRVEPALSALMSMAAVGAALVSQHVHDMQPCPWCVLQRLVFSMVAAIALIEWSWPLAGSMATSGAQPSRLNLGGVQPHDDASARLDGLDVACRGLRALMALCGAAAATWQHLVASSSASCNLTLADRIMAFTHLDEWLPDIFQARASCLEAKAWLLGVPYEFWSGMLFIMLFLLAAGPLRSTRRRRAP